MVFPNLLKLLNYFSDLVDEKNISMVIFLLWKWQPFQVPSPATLFLDCSLHSKLFISCCSLFRECDQDTSPVQVSHWDVSSHWTSATSPFSYYEEGVQWEPRVAQRIEWKVWRPFKAASSSLFPFSKRFLVLKKLLWDAAIRTLSPIPPYFHCSLCRWQAIFSRLLRLSFPIPITGFNLLCPFLLSIIFFFIPRREKKGALASQLFICKYFLYFCPDLAKVRVLKEQARESLLFPSGILAASFLASKAVYKTNGKLTFFYPCCKICFIIMYPILKCLCGLNPPNM